MDSSNKYKVIGLMSGTSMDGVDLAYCVFKQHEGSWAFSLEAAQTVRYSPAWARRLTEAKGLSGAELLQLDVEYGKYLGLLVQAFIMKNRLKGIHFVASHGHTVFHKPAQGVTYQIGNGYALHAACGLPVICDFRTMDVALNGQGAPLVPIGDDQLFNDHDICLNLGGIANVSMSSKGKRIAYDVCFANMGLNYLASKINQPYDSQGKLATQGEIDKGLSNQLDKTYGKLRKKRPSLSREIFEEYFIPLLDQEDIPLKNRLRTFTESIAKEIAEALTQKGVSMLCTGGGAFNSFLIYRLVEHCNDRISVVVPEEDIINFKEALIFAFLGVLRSRNEINTLKSVTGAKADSSSGVMIGFKKS